MNPSIEDQLDRIIGEYIDPGVAKLPEVISSVEDSKRQILNLFAHLASEAKPEKQDDNRVATKITDYYYNKGHDQGIDTYHNNILRRLGRE